MVTRALRGGRDGGVVGERASNVIREKLVEPLIARNTDFGTIKSVQTHRNSRICFSKLVWASKGSKDT